VEEPDFGMWLGDFDPDWAAHPGAWHEAFPGGSLSQGRALLRQIHHLGLAGIGADAELDVVQPGTVLAEFCRLSMVATAEMAISTGVMTAAEAARITARLNEPDFLGVRLCVHPRLGATARQPLPSRPGRHRRWVREKTLGPGRRIDSRIAREGVSRFGGQAGTQAPGPYARTTAKPRKPSRKHYPHPPCRFSLSESPPV
jgi:hypothetical protein